MALDILLRQVVALASAITKDLQVEITHEPFVSRSNTGIVTYGRPVTRRGIVDRKRRFDQSGQIAQGTIVFLDDVAFSLDDRLTLPDGSQVTVMGVNQVLDPAGGGYATEVFMGGAPQALSS